MITGRPPASHLSPWCHQRKHHRDCRPTVTIAPMGSHAPIRPPNPYRRLLRHQDLNRSKIGLSPTPAVIVRSRRNREPTTLRATKDRPSPIMSGVVPKIHRHAKVLRHRVPNRRHREKPRPDRIRLPPNQIPQRAPTTSPSTRFPKPFAAQKGPPGNWDRFGSGGERPLAQAVSDTLQPDFLKKLRLLSRIAASARDDVSEETARSQPCRYLACFRSRRARRDHA